MKVRSINKKTFELYNNENTLGQLIYQGHFSYKAEIKLSDMDHYEIKPAGFFSTSIKVMRDDIEIADLKMNWKGQIIITFKDGEEFVFKARGVFHNKYVIENKNEETLLEFNPKFKWQKFQYNYDIYSNNDPKENLFVLIGIYAVNYYIAVRSGALAAG